MKRIFFIIIALIILFQGVFSFGFEANAANVFVENKGIQNSTAVNFFPKDGGIKINEINTSSTLKEGSKGNISYTNIYKSPLTYTSIYNKENRLLGVMTTEDKTGNKSMFQPKVSLTKGTPEYDAAFADLSKDLGANNLEKRFDTQQQSNASAAIAQQQQASVCIGFLPPSSAIGTAVGVGMPTFDWQACVRDASNTALQIGSWFLWAAGILFNWTLGYSLNMGLFLEKMPLVDTGWVIFRDIANMTFIFVVLAIAIGTILQVESYNAKKLLVQVLITAVLLNFSLFFTKVIIDGSNILALQFYKQIGTQGINSANTGSATGDALANIKNNLDGGLSGAMIRGLGLTSIYQTAGNNSAILGATPGSVLTGPNMIVIGIGGFVLTLCAAFVFLAATILFIVRTVVLIFLMILSPLAFVARALPQTKGYFSKWLGALLNQSFFAPLYMVLIWVVFKTIGTNYKSIDGNDMNFAAFMTGGKDFVGTLYTFIIIIAFMLGSLIVAKTFGAYGGNFAREWAGKLSFGAAGWAGRQTAGRLGRVVAQSRIVNNVANSKAFGGAFKGLGRGVKAAGEGVAKSSFDIRGTGLGGGMIGGLGKAGGVGGIQKAIDDDKKKRADIQKSEAQYAKKQELEAAITAGDETGIRTALQKFSDSEYAELDSKILTHPKVIANSKASQIKAATDEKNEKLTTAQKKKIKDETEREFNAGQDNIRDFVARAEDASLTTAQRADAAKALQTALYTMDPSDYVKLEPGLLSNSIVIRNSRPDQIKAVTDDKNDKLSEAQKVEISKTRLQPLREALAAVKATTLGTPARVAAVADLKKIMDALPAKEKANLPADLLGEPEIFRNFDADTRGEIKKRDNLAPAQLEAMNQQRNEALVKSVTVGSVDPELTKNIMKSLSGKDLVAAHSALITAGGAGILNNNGVIDQLTADQLKDIADDSRAVSVRPLIGARIRLLGPARHGAYHKVKAPQPAVRANPATGVAASQAQKEGDLYAAFL